MIPKTRNVKKTTLMHNTICLNQFIKENIFKADTYKKMHIIYQ